MNDNLEILIADDHNLVRQGLKLALAELSGHAIIIEASSADEVHKALSEHPDLDLIILDLHMPGVTELELLTRLCNSHPDIPIVVLSAAESPRIMQRVIDRGAAGFIPKRVANDVLISALKLVLSGGIYIPSEMIGKSARTESANTGQNSKKTANLRRSNNIRPEFTDRQEEVLILLGNGDPNKIIARKLTLSEHTVKVHVAAIFKALGVNNRTEAALACRDLGLRQE